MSGVDTTNVVPLVNGAFSNSLQLENEQIAGWSSAYNPQDSASARSSDVATRPYTEQQLNQFANRLNLSGATREQFMELFGAMPQVLAQSKINYLIDIKSAGTHGEQQVAAVITEDANAKADVDNRLQALMKTGLSFDEAMFKVLQQDIEQVIMGFQID